MSKILFLGTAGTIEAMYKSAKSSSAIVIQADDVQLVINPGPGCVFNAGTEKCDLAATDAVLLSSKDLVHMNDLDVIVEIVKHHNPFKDFKIIEHNEKKYDIKGVEVRSVKLKPTETAFLVHTTKFILAYIPSFEYTKKLGEEFKDANILILSCDDTIVKNDSTLSLPPQLDRPCWQLPHFRVQFVYSCRKTWCKTCTQFTELSPPVLVIHRLCLHIRDSAVRPRLRISRFRVRISAGAPAVPVNCLPSLR